MISGDPEVAACVLGFNGAEKPVLRFAELSDSSNVEVECAGAVACGSMSSTTRVVSVVFCVIGTVDPVNSKANSSGITSPIRGYDMVPQWEYIPSSKK